MPKSYIVPNVRENGNRIIAVSTAYRHYRKNENFDLYDEMMNDDSPRVTGFWKLVGIKRIIHSGNGYYTLVFSDDSEEEFFARYLIIAQPRD